MQFPHNLRIISRFILPFASPFYSKTAQGTTNSGQARIILPFASIGFVAKAAICLAILGSFSFIYLGSVKSNSLATVKGKRHFESLGDGSGWLKGDGSLNLAQDKNFAIKADIEKTLKVLNERPDYAIAWLRLSVLYGQIGDNKQADVARENARKLNPDL